MQKEKQNTAVLVAMLILGVASIFISFAAMAICYRFDDRTPLLWTGLLWNDVMTSLGPFAWRFCAAAAADVEGDGDARFFTPLGIVLLPVTPPPK